MDNWLDKFKNNNYSYQSFLKKIIIRLIIYLRLSDVIKTMLYILLYLSSYLYSSNSYIIF